MMKKFSLVLMVGAALGLSLVMTDDADAWFGRRGGSNGSHGGTSFGSHGGGGGSHGGLFSRFRRSGGSHGGYNQGCNDCAPVVNDCGCGSTSYGGQVYGSDYGGQYHDGQAYDGQQYGGQQSGSGVGTPPPTAPSEPRQPEASREIRNEPNTGGGAGASAARSAPTPTVASAPTRSLLRRLN